jgi:hypothetical protein
MHGYSLPIALDGDTTNWPVPGLPDFSLNNIPKREKYTK